MVAVFLRHVEYYRGILFLTTNRITTFDEAFLSRIHVALHFSELPRDARARIWRAFLKKAGLEAQYPVGGAPLAKGRGRGKTAPSKIPSLSVDGDKMGAETEIGEAELEDGDLVEVVGL